MLKIWVNEVPETEDRMYIPVPGVYFDNTYEDSWIKTDFVRDIIKDVDKSELIDRDCVISPVLGAIPLFRIAGGTKAAILMKFNDEVIVNASSCGDNVAKWIASISKEKDLTIRLGHIMDFNGLDIEGVILNTGRSFSNVSEYLDAFMEVPDDWDS